MFNFGFVMIIPIFAGIICIKDFIKAAIRKEYLGYELVTGLILVFGGLVLMAHYFNGSESFQHFKELFR
jgi:hypothetical protein